MRSTGRSRSARARTRRASGTGRIPEVSRRGLLGLGLRRAVEGRRAELTRAAETFRHEDEHGSVRDSWWNEGDPRPFGRVTQPAADALVEACAISSGERVLDLAAGDGNVALAAARRGAEVVACDRSDAMVARGFARSEAAGYDVDWRVCDARRLPFPAESFDAVASSFGIAHAGDARLATSELDRVTRPGGRIGVAAWTPTGVMGRALAAAAQRLRRPDARSAARWGRYEDAYRRFGFHADFEVRDQVLALEAPSVAAGVELILDAPGPLNARDPVREALAGDLAEILSPHAHKSGSGIAVELDYVLITARRRV